MKVEKHRSLIKNEKTQRQMGKQVVKKSCISLITFNDYSLIYWKIVFKLSKNILNPNKYLKKCIHYLNRIYQFENHKIHPLFSKFDSITLLEQRMSSYPNHFKQKPNFTKVPQKLLEEIVVEQESIFEKKNKIRVPGSMNKPILKKKKIEREPQEKRIRWRTIITFFWKEESVQESSSNGQQEYQFRIEDDNHI